MRFPSSALSPALGASFLLLCSAAIACGPIYEQKDDPLERATPTSVAPDEAMTSTHRPIDPLESQPTRELARFPTPSSQSDTMIVGGSLWVDGKPASGEVLAFVGGQLCGSGQSGVLLHADAPSFVIEIASAAEQRGCGVPGAPVVITINGRALDDMIEWQPGFQQPIRLFAGPRVAVYSGAISVGGNPAPFEVVAYIDGKVCGDALVAMIHPGDKVYYRLVVEPAELRLGCGRDGAQVMLQIEFGGLKQAIATVPWQANDAVSLPETELPGWIPVEPLPAIAWR